MIPCMQIVFEPQRSSTGHEALASPTSGASPLVGHPGDLPSGKISKDEVQCLVLACDWLMRHPCYDHLDTFFFVASLTFFTLRIMGLG